MCFFQNQKHQVVPLDLEKLKKKKNHPLMKLGSEQLLIRSSPLCQQTNLEKQNVYNLTEKVVEMAKVVPENQYCGLAESDKIKQVSKQEVQKLEICDTYEPTMSLIEKEVIKLEESALDNKEITNSEGAEIAYSKNSICLLGSNGLEIEMEKTHSDFIIAVLAGSKDSMEREYDYKSKVFYNELGDFEKIGKEVSQNAIKKLNSRKLKTCKSDVIFDSKVSSSLLRNLFSASNAQSIVKGISFLKDKMNNKIFNDRISIIDDPLMPKKLRSKISDCEGIQSKKKFLIEKGYLKFFFNSLASAKQIKHEPSGHATRSASSIPSVSYSNLYMENGEVSKLDMIKSLKKGLLITELMGSSINYSNGDYSRGASGFWIENGEICYPVSEITIAGNLVDIFMSLIPANDLEFNFGINAPSCLVENLTLGGK